MCKKIKENALELSGELLVASLKEILNFLPFDEILKNLVGVFPMLSAGKTAISIITAFHDYAAINRLRALSEAVQKEKGGYEKYSALDEKEQKKIAEIIFVEVEKQSNELQSSATGYLLNAYLKKEIKYDDFIGVLHELKNMNPTILMFDSEDRISSDGNGLMGDKIDYLPAAFKSVASGTSIVINPGYTSITSFGKIFYEYIYRCMLDDYQKRQ